MSYKVNYYKTQMLWKLFLSIYSSDKVEYLFTNKIIFFIRLKSNKNDLRTTFLKRISEHVHGCQGRQLNIDFAVFAESILFGCSTLFV